ncbi:sel1 repeat family protein [Bacteroides faecis]|jgi:hypothetical protein|uniref:tetratricopeptide repeat protein n=1 Tax=Bacteroides faecis TaxID=674529 RepID=UPI001EE89B2C|nr:tetratricopeptide repeat protein [Bacteroides faecis]MCS2654404.1 sel1 repeat family protein [Bacteroides faecis]UYU57776.1 sel1 repeat family protein [Bacteroides faecis]
MRKPCYLLAQDYENKGNFDDTFSWYNKAAMQGLADGINNVAMYYLEGLVVTPDVDKTINLLESIADKIPVAKINLVCIYLEEKGCPQDSEKGMELLRHAVSGEGPAAFTIGKIHLGGMYGAPVDYKIAIKWFEKAYALEIYENVEILCDFYEGLYSRKVKNREKYKLWSDIRKDIAARKSDLYFQVLLTMPVIPEDLSDVSVMKEADGRQYIIINNKKVYPDLLVARTFLPNMNTELYTEVEHIDGDMSNNSARNLRWIKKK